ncbi:alpha/beta fold hydrolase [Nocardia jiangsuensis]|uniref:Alpha/beta fold hydrolase n=1 Tax=Nocardia jiangsuensis TaxID=1691563 RepID=A0ABV8DRR8_9NOCA
MTLADLRAGPEPVLAEVDGIPVSGLRAVAEAPRAVLVAMHGGATSGGYFDCPGHPELSLFRIAHRLGYTVVAPDRPGYGASAPFADDLIEPERRLDLMFGAVEAFLGDRPRGAGTFLLAHSAGCEQAVRMAVDPRADDLLGLEVSGTGHRPHPDFVRAFEARQRDDRTPGVGALIWTPERLYPPDIRGGAAIGAPGPRMEATALRTWSSHDFPELAARVRVPVRFTTAEYERVWRGDPEALAEVGALFTAAPRVVLNRQPNSGHNISVGHTAAAYHLGVLAFLEECVVAAVTGEFTGPTPQFDGGSAPSGR